MSSTSAIAHRRFIGVELWRYIAAFVAFYVIATAGNVAADAVMIERIHVATTLGFTGGVVLMWLSNHQEVPDDE